MAMMARHADMAAQLARLSEAHHNQIIGHFDHRGADAEEHPLMKSARAMKELASSHSRGLATAAAAEAAASPSAGAMPGDAMAGWRGRAR